MKSNKYIINKYIYIYITKPKQKTQNKNDVEPSQEHENKHVGKTEKRHTCNTHFVDTKMRWCAKHSPLLLSDRKYSEKHFQNMSQHICFIFNEFIRFASFLYRNKSNWCSLGRRFLKLAEALRYIFRSLNMISEMRKNSD